MRIGKGEHSLTHRTEGGGEEAKKNLNIRPAAVVPSTYIQRRRIEHLDVVTQSQVQLSYDRSTTIRYVRRGEKLRITRAVRSLLNAARKTHKKGRRNIGVYLASGIALG